MTDISVHNKASLTAEDRSWLIPQPGGIGFGYTPSATLDVSTFTQADHYPTGYIKSGIVLGKITATGKYGPYVTGLSDGRQVAAGILFNSTTVPNLLDLTVDVGSVMVAAFAVVKESRLPANHGLDAGARTALKLIHFEA